VKTIIAGALFFFATTAFADSLRSDRHFVKIDVQARQYHVQIFNADSRGQVASLKVVANGDTPAEANTVAGGVTYTVRVQPHGEAYVVDFTAHDGTEVIDSMRGGFSTAVKPQPVRPQPLRGGRDVNEAKVLRRIEPVYTEEAKAAGAAGSVVVEVLIDRSGFVREATAVRGLGHGLTESALEAVRQWQFEASMQGHTPVEVLQEVTVEFKP
jgi:TonB family protein